LVERNGLDVGQRRLARGHQHEAGAEVAGDPALLFAGPAHVHGQDDGPEPCGRQQGDDVIRIVAERHADDVARSRADIFQMAGGLRNQAGELRIGDRARAVDDGRM
jgi:hypothetical protein